MVEVPSAATRIPEPRQVDLSRLMKTSPLVVGFRPLPSQNLINSAIPFATTMWYPPFLVSTPTKLSLEGCRHLRVRIIIWSHRCGCLHVVMW